MAKILIADDEANMRRVLSVILKADGHGVTEASGVEEAKRALISGSYDLLLTDMKMGDGDGLSLLAASREADPTLPVVFLTAYATVELAVEAMRAGAFDFIAKPFLPEPVKAVVRRACERAELLRENDRLRGQVRRLTTETELIGRSPAMMRVREMIAKVAPTSATVLITGETGTGKELAARAIHNQSPRASQPFLAVNCAAFTESLLESELFGHERGAFTGADRTRTGLFEAAHRGTLFLDEAGEMSLALQARLLRVLMDGQVMRVGSTSPRTVDVRILVATHRDLRRRAEEGLFRQDLYYRLAVVPLEIPPLRERKQDIPLLADHALVAVARDLKIPPRRLTPAALASLAAYSFPGNVRELRNLIERAYILAGGEDELRPEDFPSVMPKSSPGGARDALPAVPDGMDLRSALEAMERGLIERALHEAGGVQAEAARRLGVSRSDLSYKVKRLKIQAGGKP